MADDVQYVKLPSGEYGKFRADASDDAIRSQIMKDFPSAFESQKQQPPNKPIASPSEMIGEGEEVGAQGNAELGKQYVQAGPMEVGRGVSEIAKGNVGHGIHRAVTGAGVTALPAVAATLPIALASAPLATAGGLIGSAALSPTLKYGTKALGANEDWSNVAGDAGAVMGGMGGARLGGALSPLLSRLSLESPEKIPLPFGFKINRNVPSDPYEEMGSSAQYTDMAHDAMKPKLTADEIAQNRLNQKVANINAEVRTGLRPSTEEQMQSMLEKEFGAGESASRVPQDIRSPRAITPTYVQEGTPGAPQTADEIAQNRLNQKVANIGAEVRAGLRPSPEEQIQSTLDKEFSAGESSGRVPQDIRPPRTPVPTYPPTGSPSAPSSRASGSVSSAFSPSTPQETSPNVLLAPMRNKPFPNNPSGNIQNVPRELLPDIIHRTGDPAAVGEFSRTTNIPALYVPESIGSGPRQTPWSPNAPGNPIPAIPSPDVTPTSAPDPTPAYAGAERRTSVRDITGPDFMRGAQMQDIRNRLTEPSLPDAERVILQNRLDDMRAHPFERNELGNDLNAFKTQKTMTRAEAEANTQKRMEGRNKRFGL